MTVWTLSRDNDYGNYEIIAVFTSRVRADTFIEEFCKADTSASRIFSPETRLQLDLNLEEFEVQE